MECELVVKDQERGKMYIQIKNKKNVIAISYVI